LRLATAEEAAAYDLISAEADEAVRKFSERDKQEKTYHDATPSPEVLEQMMHIQERTSKIKRPRRSILKDSRSVPKRRGRPRKVHVRDMDEELPEEVVEEQSIPQLAERLAADQVPIPSDSDDLMTGEQKQAYEELAEPDYSSPRRTKSRREAREELQALDGVYAPQVLSGEMRVALLIRRAESEV
jgi:hypothetical protein